MKGLKPSNKSEHEAELVTERLEKRITLLEQKVSPPEGSFGSFDIVRHIHDIRIEKERLMQLSQSDYEKELKAPPTAKVEQMGRIGVANQKRLLSLTPEEREREMGYIYKPELTSAQKEQLASPKNWITDLFAERTAKSKI